MPFLDSLDIANRACQHLGATRIASPTEDSVNNAEIAFAYDKLRRAELRRNAWRFSIKKAVLRPIDTTTFLLSPAQWNAGIQYLPGSVVADSNGQLWVSNMADNLGNDPNLTDVWDSYYGSMTVDAYDTTGSTAYYAGDLVYIQNADSFYNIYMSLQNANVEVPNTADVWSATNTYQEDETVSYNGMQWRSLIALNTNNTPVQGPSNWVATQSYAQAAQVTGTDGFIYNSVAGSNLGNNPVTDNGTYWINTDVPNAWTNVPVIPASSSLWVPLYASLVSFNFVYPIGYGPASQQTTRNIFRLPAGYLRPAPQDPKAGLYSFLGAPAYNTQEDWEYEGNFLLSRNSTTPIIFRFVADVTNVSEMDDLFCECFAARIAVETCEPITNSNVKQQTCNNAYKFFRGEAITVNGIEVGPVEPPEDDYIVCRL
jgi:hypothetical protein